MQSKAFPLAERIENQAWYRCSTGKTCEPVLGHIPKRDHFFWADSDKDEGYVPVLREDREKYPLPLRYYLDTKKCEIHCHEKARLAKSLLAMSIPRLKISDFASPQYISAELALTHPTIAPETERYLSRKMPPLERIVTDSEHKCIHVFGENVATVIRKHLEQYQTECIENKLETNWAYRLVFDYLYMRVDDEEEDPDRPGDTRTIVLLNDDRPVLSVEHRASEAYILRNLGEGQIPPITPIVHSERWEKKLRASVNAELPEEDKRCPWNTPFLYCYMKARQTNCYCRRLPL